MKKLLAIFFLFSVSLFSQHDTTIVLLSSIDPTITSDVKYATTNNFTGKVLYPSAKVYLRKIVGDSLARVQQYLKQNYNYRLKVFDGYRPLSVQKFMWDLMPNTDFVANPKKGSKHNRGAAVDLTIIDSIGNELDMGTPFDEFSVKAAADYTDLPPEILKNRKILQDTMTRFGFNIMTSEWWHFDFNCWKKFAVLDVPIE